MASRLWGPWTVVLVFTLAGGLIGGDIAMWPWDEPPSAMIPIATGALTGLLAGGIIAWFVRQVEEMN